MDNADSFQPIDLRAIAVILRRYSKPIVLGSVIACAGLFATLEALPDRYTAEAVILRESASGSLQDFEGIRVENRSDSGSGTESEASVLRSDGFLGRLVAEIGLQRLSKETSQGPLSVVKDEIQAAVQQAAAMLGMERSPSDDADKIRAFKLLKANLEVRGDEKLPFLKIHYTHEDPELAAEIVNAAAKLLLDDRRAALARRLDKVIAALHVQIDKISRQIATAADQAGRLRSDLNYFSTPTGSILAQQITEATRTLSDATIEVSVATARYGAAVAAAGHDRSNRAISELVDSPVLRRLVMEETTQKLDDAELASTMGTRYPARRQVKSRLADINVAIQREISNLLAALQQKVVEAQSRQKALQDRLDELRTRTAEAGKVDLAIQMNERQLDGLLHSRNGLGRLLQQLQFGTSDVDRLQIASAGVAPLTPSQPHRLAVFSIGSVVILGMAITLAIAHAVATGKVLTVQGVRTADLAREVFCVPSIERARRRRLLANPSRLGQRLDRHLMRRIRDITLWMTTEKGPEPITVAVSSLDHGEGKTTLSMLLAYGFATIGRRVIIVDYDHCNRGATIWLDDITRREEARSTPTLYVDSEKPLPIIHRTGCDGLYYSTASKEMCLATFAGDRSSLARYLDNLHTEFDVVVIDTPPLELVTETINVMPLSTYHLVVADWRKARFDRLAQARALFERYRSGIDLIVFNRCPVERRARRALRRYGYDPEERIASSARSIHQRSA